MRSHLIGRLGLSLLALGVIPLPERPFAASELDLKEVERTLDDLAANGIDAPAVHAIAGSPERFANIAKICLANKALLAEHGCPDVTDPEVLLGRTDGQVVPESLVRLSSGRLARRPPPRAVISDGFDQQAEVTSRSLHLCGYCCCGREGTCQWCVMNAKREADEAAAAAKHEAVCEVRRQNRGQQASARKVRQGKKSKRGF